MLTPLRRGDTLDRIPTALRRARYVLSLELTMRSRLLLAGAALLLLSSACSQPATSSETGKTTIGLVTQAWDNPAIKDLADAATAQAGKHANVTLLAQDSSNMQDMISKVQTMISRKVDALGIEPWDKQQIMPMLQQAKQAKIPVFILQSQVPGTEGNGLVVTSIIGDETAGGKVAGRWLGEKLGGSGRVLVLEGAPADTPGIERANGFEQGLKESAPNATVVARQPADWARDKALRVTTDLLTANSNIDAIFADNDEMAFGALAALRARKLEGKVTLIGYNGTCIGLKATYDGTFAADGILFLDQVGSKFIDAALDQMNGKQVPPKIEPPITLLTTAHLKEIEQGAKSVTVNGSPFDVDDALRKRVTDAIAGKC
ncbi:sugar ABC transporter substrate-binding protein [Dactylosporangium sp. CA-233914]|uniref:sugar ABC transporter substrate-binding protein n=1 Tax=Dactylosporangium sp. CA-233914 TaxID=3239934 RepID=UPI003D922F6A